MGCPKEINNTSSPADAQKHMGMWILEDLSSSVAFTRHTRGQEFKINESGIFALSDSLHTYSYSIFMDLSDNKFVYRRLKDKEKYFFKVDIINNDTIKISDSLATNANNALAMDPTLVFAKRK